MEVSGSIPLGSIRLAAFAARSYQAIRWRGECPELVGGRFQSSLHIKTHLCYFQSSLMNQSSQPDFTAVVSAAALSILLVTSLFVWQGQVGFNLGDEGFLWYGVQRVMVGEVPLRDFMAYDPGRYYWSAAWMNAFGDQGIIALRASVAIFQTLGLFTGLLLIARSIGGQRKERFLYLIISGLTMVIWMFPRHKLFDSSLSIFLIGVLTALIHRPSLGRYFYTGICIGLVAFFGRNHGLYGLAGCMGVIIYLNIKINQIRCGDLFRELFSLAAGVLLGLLPLILMALFTPGFASAFLESIRFLFEVKSTNLPLPIPWPWTIDFASLSTNDGVRALLVGIFFLGTLIFGIVASVWVIFQRYQGRTVSPALVACAFMAIPYTHFAYSRADIAHLAQSIFPFLIGCLVVLSTYSARVRWPGVIILCAISGWVMHRSFPGWICRVDNRCKQLEVSGDILTVEPNIAADVDFLRQLDNQYLQHGKKIFVAPFWPGTYALFNQKAPVWEIYTLYPRSEEFQRREIERIKKEKIGVVLIVDLALDGRDDLRFKNTRPIIQQFIEDYFEFVPNQPNPVYQIYRPKT